MHSTKVSDEITVTGQVSASQLKEAHEQRFRSVLNLRAGAMAFMHMATRSGLSAEQAMEQVQASGFDCNSEPQLKQFFEHYVDAHSSAVG